MPPNNWGGGVIQHSLLQLQNVKVSLFTAGRTSRLTIAFNLVAVGYSTANPIC